MRTEARKPVGPSRAGSPRWRGMVPVGAVLVVGALVGGSPEPELGWQRLWRPQWQRVQLGDRWELGLVADGLGFDAGGASVFRATLVNTGTGAAESRLTGPGFEMSWRVPAGEALPVEAAVERPGGYSISSEPTVMLCSPRVGRPRPRPRLLVLVVVDTLRADHVSPALMPGILASFESGLRFRDATANSSWTLPSLASMFTSRPVLDLTTPEGDLLGIPEGLGTWARQLEANGFIGGAFVANYTVHVLNGFAQGFSTYSVPDGHGSPDHPDAASVVERAGQWLSANHGEDAFLLVHLMDPHEPYRDHGPAGRRHPPLGPLAARERTATPEEAALLRELYAGEVRHVDAVLAPFLAGLPAHAVVAFTSDHGELLGEHGCWGHGLSLFQEAVAVPLLLKGPGVSPGLVTDPVQLVDVAPTLLDLMGCPRGKDMLGRSLLDGGSDLPAVSATFGAGPLRWSWRHGRHKVLLHLQAQPGPEPAPRGRLTEVDPLPAGVTVFDLGRDPDEQRPRPLRGALVSDAGNAFAATAGAMVPGVQVVLWGERGPVDLDLETGGETRVAQTWATSPVELEVAGGLLRLSCRDAFPVLAVTTATEAPFRVRVRSALTPTRCYTLSWRRPTGAPAPPHRVLPGRVTVWWNGPRERTVSAYHETLETLRSLGYVR